MDLKLIFKPFKFTWIAVVIFLFMINISSSADIFPITKRENGRFIIAIDGITLGDHIEKIKEVFSHKGIKPLRETNSILEYKVPFLSINNIDIEKVQLRFYKGFLYKITLIFGIEKSNSWDLYLNLKNLLEEKYGMCNSSSKDGEGTYASAIWEGLYNKNLTINLTWKEDPGVVCIHYQYNPVFFKLLNEMRRKYERIQNRREE